MSKSTLHPIHSGATTEQPRAIHSGAGTIEQNASEVVAGEPSKPVDGDDTIHSGGGV